MVDENHNGEAAPRTIVQALIRRLRERHISSLQALATRKPVSSSQLKNAVRRTKSVPAGHSAGGTAADEDGQGARNGLRVRETPGSKSTEELAERGGHEDRHAGRTSCQSTITTILPIALRVARTSIALAP